MKYLFLFLLFLFILNISFSFPDEKQYYFVFLNSNPEREELPHEEVMKLQEGHMNNIGKLAEENKLLTAGPVKGGGGIFILMAPSLEEAEEYLENDPAIKAKRFKTEVYPMNIAEGNICKVPEDDFEMVSYTLLRYEGDFSIEDKKNLLVQIEFEGRDDGIVVFKYDLEKGNEDELKDNIADARINYIKTLWIGKGSFCE
jgi:uncharacterized protein YciI